MDHPLGHGALRAAMLVPPRDVYQQRAWMQLIESRYFSPGLGLLSPPKQAAAHSSYSPLGWERPHGRPKIAS